ncbi:MAG: hypothetical protein ACE5GO_03330, partial [Anaerolineales bacterium]
MTIRVVAIDDHPIILRFIQDELAKQMDLELVGTQDHGSHLLKLVRTANPDGSLGTGGEAPRYGGGGG